MSKIETKDVIKIVKEKGYELLTTGELGRTTRIKVKCHIHEFIWETCYHNIRHANGNCKFCSRNFESFKEIKDTIESKNGTLIERIIKGSTTYIIRCNIHDVIFTTRWETIKNGSWCSKCGNGNRRITYQQIKSEIEEKDGTLLAQNCSTATELFLVKCNKDQHEWTTSWARIKQGCWCPKCAGCDKYTVGEVQDIINKRGGTLINTNIKSVKQKVSIKCACGEVFTSDLNHIIHHDVWCQICKDKRSKQRELFYIIKNIYKDCEVEYNYRGFNWLKSKKTNIQRLEIDIFVYNNDRSFSLAIEYDGEQHFRPVRFGGMSVEKSLKVFKMIKKNDATKNRLIKKHPEEVKYFIRFNYKDSINLENVIKILKINKAI